MKEAKLSTSTQTGNNSQTERPRGEGVQLGPKGQFMRNLPGTVRAEVERYRRTVGEANGTPGASREQLLAHTDTLQNESRKRLKEAYDAAEREYNEKVAGFNKVLRPQLTDTNSKLLATVERDRAWRRIKAIIDADPKDALRVIKLEAHRAGAIGDIETINALDEEVPAYIRAQKLDEGFVRESSRLVSEARALTYSPEQKAAAQQLKALDKVWYRSKMAYEQGGHILTKSIDDEEMIVGANEGEVLSVGAYRKAAPRLPGLSD